MIFGVRSNRNQSRSVDLVSVVAEHPIVSGGLFSGYKHYDAAPYIKLRS